MTKSYFKKEKELVENRLGKLLPKSSARPQALHKAIRYSVFSGGKRLRPIMLLEACKACGGRAREAIDAACAVEMVHTYSLIHDDLPSMDNDDYRRGKPTCHKRFGEATAILAGDALLTQAFSVLARAKKEKYLSKAARKLSGAIGSLGMVGGQEIDLKKKGSKSGRDLKFIAENKTAELFRAAAALGAIFAGATKREEKALERFGKLFGIAFQLADDAFDNDGFARVMGRKDTLALAENFMKKARNELRIFGRKANRLKELTNTVIARKPEGLTKQSRLLRFARNDDLRR